MTKSYEEYVRLGKEMLSSIRCYQVQIAHYATIICQIKHGGKEKGLYTLAMYSKDIGVNRKTLSGWVNIYRVVIQKLDIDLDEVTVRDWYVASRVHELLKKEKQAINEAIGTIKAKDKGWKINTPPEKIKSMFKSHGRQRPIESEVHSWTDTIIGIKNKIRTKDLSGASTESLMMLKKNLDRASCKLTNYLMDERNISIKELVE
jgi:hypothetical protein